MDESVHKMESEIQMELEWNQRSRMEMQLELNGIVNIEWNQG